MGMDSICSVNHPPKV
ncbi:hypothetical protein CP061683_0655, partial [Chlamydia psittaci 06-1683]